MAVDLSDPDFVASITATLSTIMLVAVQAGLGCTVTVMDLRDNMRRPLAVGVGLFAQVLGMPLIAYGLAASLKIKGDGLLGLALVACTPGGSMSNVFSYFSRGSMSLSITLTVLSNLIAFGSMPLALFLLAPDSAVPFMEVVKTLALTIVPTAFGIALKTYAPRIALWGEKLGAGIGGIAVLGAIISGIAGNAKQLPLLPPELFISTALLGALGIVLAWVLAVMARIHGSRRITLCIETGVQNLALTLALIALSFGNKFDVVVYSYVYGFVICIECAIFSALVRWPPVRLRLCGVDPSELEAPEAGQADPTLSPGKELESPPAAPPAALAAGAGRAARADVESQSPPVAGRAFPFSAFWGGSGKSAVAARV